MGPDELPRLVWNKGIAARCDRRFPDEFPDGRNYVPESTRAGDNITDARGIVIDHPEQHATIGGGELLWVRASWLPAFIEQVLPHIHGDFVLVTGDSDCSLPSGAPSVAATLFANPHLVHWYAQNYDGAGPPDRMSPLPIGLDLHPLSERPIWGEDVTSPSSQEAQLLAIAEALPPVIERDPRCYLGPWSWHTTAPPTGARLMEPRSQIAEGLGLLPHVVWDGPHRRSELWQCSGQYAFTVSPHGTGLDTHRAWEALVLGQIVLVPTSSLDPLFEELRVVPVDSWSSITEGNLRRWLAEKADIPHPSPALMSQYWIDRMRRAVSGSTDQSSRI
jgi:hypothetical protein